MEVMLSEFRKPLGEAVVKIKHLSKRFALAGRQDEIVALADIHVDDNSEFFPVRKGEFVMLRGPSGGGKSTLLHALGTLDRPSEGEIELFGSLVNSECSDDHLADLRLHKIGFVFQTFNLLATMSAFENVELPMTLTGQLNEKQRKEKALELLKSVGLQDRVNHLPSELSGGEQQRVFEDETIARALANDPDLLLLDEPTGDLDTLNTIEIMDLLLSINNGIGTTCIMVLNPNQSRLDYKAYMAYLASQDLVV